MRTHRKRSKVGNLVVRARAHHGKGTILSPKKKSRDPREQVFLSTHTHTHTYTHNYARMHARVCVFKRRKRKKCADLGEPIKSRHQPPLDSVGTLILAPDPKYPSNKHDKLPPIHFTYIFTVGLLDFGYWGLDRMWCRRDDEIQNSAI